MSSSQKNTRATTELARFEDIMEKKLTEFGRSLAVEEGFNDLKDMFKELCTTLANQKLEIDSLNVKVTRNDLKISQLEDKVAVLTASVNAMKSHADNNEQYSRRQCLRINGIPKEDNESSNKCVDKVIDLCKNSLKVNIEKADIDRAHRVGKERKTMIVKFFSFSKRTSVYRARKAAGNQNHKIYLDLTHQRLNLLDKCKEKITENCKVKFVFADVNCNTVAKMKDDTFKFFDNEDKFDNILFDGQVE